MRLKVVVVGATLLRDLFFFLRVIVTIFDKNPHETVIMAIIQTGYFPPRQDFSVKHEPVVDVHKLRKKLEMDNEPSSVS